MNVLITGAAGNLGSLTTRYFLKHTDIRLNLLIHKKNVPREIKNNGRVTVYRGDLHDKETLYECLKGVEVIVHFAGVLFMHNPEKFLTITNTLYFKNLCDAAVTANIKRIILISFPHVEGVTTRDNPAVGRLDRNPDSIHAKTRLEQEKYLFHNIEKHGIEAVSLRAGLIYGSGILMIDAARWLLKRWLIGVWREPTWIHLISRDDFLESLKAAAIKPGIKGIYHLGDDGIQTLQDFLDIAAYRWRCKKAWRMPVWLIFFAARLCEFQSRLFGTKAPITKDFIKIGMASFYGETSRMRQELLKNLIYKTIQEGQEIL